MMKQLLLVLAFLFCLFSCQRKEKTDVLRVEILDDALDTYSFHDFFEKVEIIILEDSCLTANGQFSEPQYLSVWNGGFIILDERDGTSYSFDPEGLYLGEISRRGRAENEYSLAYGVDVNESSGIMTILDPRSTLYRYGINGEFVGKEHIEGVVAVHGFCEQKDAIVLFSASSKENLSKWENGELSNIKYKAPFDLKNQFNAPYPFIEHEGNMYYYEGATGKIFALNLTDNMAKAVYSWDFGEHTAKISKLKKNREDFFATLKGDFYNCIYPFLNLTWTESVMVANVLYHNSEHSLFYDLSTGKSCLVHYFTEGVRFKFMTGYNNALYLLTDPESLDEFVCSEILDEENKARLKKIYEHQANPIILKYSGLRLP
ncbi:MAG: 6-bladed beta-propeller [Bacteroidales bacterium]|nr:6-bladed beta-propeller [Bacteroidales bacterium]